MLVQGLAHTKDVLLCTLLSYQLSSFGVWDLEIVCLLFLSRLHKQNQLIECQRKFLHVTNCQEVDMSIQYPKQTLPLLTSRYVLSALKHLTNSPTLPSFRIPRFSLALLI